MNSLSESLTIEVVGEPYSICSSNIIISRIPLLVVKNYEIFFIKLEFLTQFPASNDKKMTRNYKKYTSPKLKYMINPEKLSYLNFQPPEVVSRYREAENYLYL